MKRLIKRLNALPDSMLARARAAALASAEQAASIAREIVPVDTGELRQSIGFAPTGNGAVVTAEAPHAAMVEFGTTKMPPRPFMLPAARAVQKKFFQTAGEDKT